MVIETKTDKEQGILQSTQKKKNYLLKSNKKLFVTNNGLEFARQTYNMLDWDNKKNNEAKSFRSMGKNNFSKENKLLFRELANNTSVINNNDPNKAVTSTNNQVDNEFSNNENLVSSITIGKDTLQDEKFKLTTLDTRLSIRDSTTSKNLINKLSKFTNASGVKNQPFISGMLLKYGNQFYLYYRI